MEQKNTKKSNQWAQFFDHILSIGDMNRSSSWNTSYIIEQQYFIRLNLARKNVINKAIINLNYLSENIRRWRITLKKTLFNEYLFGKYPSENYYFRGKMPQRTFSYI